MTIPRSRDMDLPIPPAPEWNHRADPAPEAVALLQRELSLSRVVCGLLVARGIADPELARSFLRPRLTDLPSPREMRDLDLAADRILRAIAEGEKILVHGDYDVDGVCAAALLTRWLRRLGAHVVPFVPHRTRDGYDLGPAGIRAALEVGATLLVTCDSGIVAHEAVREAQAAGIEVIVTDHHTPGDTLPPATAVVNPARSDCDYPSPVPCGAGVAFKLCQRLAERRGINPEELWPHLDLVALATVADLVQLRGENRIFVRFGLRYLAHTTKPGLRALLEVAGITPGDELDAGTVGFVVAPRINAVGRMADAATALRLLLTEDPREASALAAELDEENRRRQEEDRHTLDRALDQLAKAFDPERDFGLVIEGEGWHPGVIGIVASRVVERIHRPVIIVSLDGENGRGSGRSIPGVHLLDAIREGGAHLRRFGGHRQAAGLDLSRSELPAFRAAFNGAVREQLGDGVPRPSVGGDLVLSMGEVDESLYRTLRHLGPFGMGNPRPVFLARGVALPEGARVVGADHLKLRLAEGGHELEGIGFGLARRVPTASLGSGPVDALFHLRENEYRGRRSLQARLVDVRPSGAPRPLADLPEADRPEADGPLDARPLNDPPVADFPGGGIFPE